MKRRHMTGKSAFCCVFPFTSASEELLPLPPFSPAPLSHHSQISTTPLPSLPPSLSLPLSESCPPRRLAFCRSLLRWIAPQPSFLPPCVRCPGSCYWGHPWLHLDSTPPPPGGGFAGWLSPPDPSGLRIRRKRHRLCRFSAPCRRAWRVGGESGLSGLVLVLDYSGDASWDGARGRRCAEAGTGAPPLVAAAAAGLDLVASRDLPPCRAHALRPAPQPEGAVPAARRSECRKPDFV